MASVVSIKIVVDNGQALPSIDQLNQGLASVGVKGTASFAQASAGADRMKGHVSTGLDSVRLLSQEFGLRLPRAIEAMLSRMPAVTTALSGLLGVMAGIVALQVFVHLAEEAHRLYTEYISLTAIQEKYLDGLDKARIADIGNTHSLETTKQRLALETQIAAQLHEQARTIFTPATLFHAGTGTQADRLRAHDLEKKATEADEARNVLARKLAVDDTHAAAMAQIELNHASDGELVGRQKVNAEMQKKIQLNAEERRNSIAQDRQFGNVTNPNSGAAEQQNKDAQARMEAAAQNTIAGRESALAIMKARDAATQAGLSGEDLYRQKMLDDIKEITRQLENQGKAAEIPASVRTINEKYFADASERFVKAQNEGALAIQKANASGLKGGARISAEHDISVNEANTKDPATASQLRLAAGVEEIQKQQELQDSFADHVKALEDSRLEASLNAFEKINGGAQKEMDALAKLYEDDTKNAQLTDAQKQQSASNLQAGITAITGAAQQQRQELAERNAADDLQYAQQAAEAERRVRANGITGWITSYKDGIVEIQAQEAARLAKLQEDVTKEGLTQQEALQRQQDITREANANIAEQNQQMQEKIAGDLQSAFTNPVDFIKSQMEKMFFEIIAGWIMKMNIFKNLFGQTMGSLAPGAPTGATGAGGFTGTIAQAIPGMRGIVNGSPSVSSIYGPASTSAGGASSSSGSAPRLIPAAATYTTGGGFGAGGFGNALGNIHSAASTLGQIPGFRGLTNASSLSSIPGTRGIVNGTVTNGDNDLFTAGISDAQAQAAINSGTIGTQPGGGLQQGLGIAGTVGTAGYSAEQTTVKAFESGNALQGALGDAASGAAIGSVIAPGIGTAIGAGIGAAVGASAGLLGMVTGEGGNLAARDYYEKNVLPTLESLMTSTGDYQTDVSNVGKTAGDAVAYMQDHFGRSAAHWVENNYLDKEAAKVLKRIEDTAAGGRQYIGKSAVQFHTGGTIAGFGDLATSSNEGFIHAMLNETVMNPAASMTHAPYLSAMQSGASHADIAAMYLAGAKPSSSSSSPSGGDTHHHWNVNALDAKSFDGFLKNGGARQITKHTNNYNSQYAGDGISG